MTAGVVLKCLAGMAAGTVLPVGCMLFIMEVLPDLVRMTWLAFRGTRAVFLGIGWALAIMRLFLA